MLLKLRQNLLKAFNEFVLIWFDYKNVNKFELKINTKQRLYQASNTLTRSSSECEDKTDKLFKFFILFSISNSSRTRTLKIERQSNYFSNQFIMKRRRIRRQDKTMSRQKDDKFLVVI